MLNTGRKELVQPHEQIHSTSERGCPNTRTVMEGWRTGPSSVSSRARPLTSIWHFVLSGFLNRGFLAENVRKRSGVPWVSFFQYGCSILFLFRFAAI